MHVCMCVHMRLPPRHFTSHEPWIAAAGEAGLGCEGFLLQKLIPDTTARKPPVGKEENHPFPKMQGKMLWDLDTTIQRMNMVNYD